MLVSCMFFKSGHFLYSGFYTVESKHGMYVIQRQKKSIEVNSRFRFNPNERLSETFVF